MRYIIYFHIIIHHGPGGQRGWGVGLQFALRHWIVQSLQAWHLKEQRTGQFSGVYVIVIHSNRYIYIYTYMILYHMIWYDMLWYGRILRCSSFWHNVIWNMTCNILWNMSWCVNYSMILCIKRQAQHVSGIRNHAPMFHYRSKKPNTQADSSKHDLSTVQKVSHHLTMINFLSPSHQSFESRRL